jgi:hypothetical protein
VFLVRRRRRRRSPWWRRSNEITEGLVRQYLPKGVAITVYQSYLEAVADELRDRPRQTQLPRSVPRSVAERRRRSDDLNPPQRQGKEGLLPKFRG